MFAHIQQEPSIHWKRAIVFVDMNAFFASIEQRDHPEWRGRPIAITNGKQGTCIITCSYEARAWGVRTGMRLREAEERCPNLLIIPSRPELYAQTSQSIMDALLSITPDIEIFSIDEAFLDVTRCQSLWGTPEQIGLMAKQVIYKVSGLLCSIGVSSDKTTAKWAGKQQKPNGFTIVPPWEAKARLQNVPVCELCGIGEGIRRFLYKYGAVTCGDVGNLPIGILAKRFGNLGRRLWYMCQGADPDPVHTQTRPPQSMGHGKVMPPRTKDKIQVLTYLRHMTERLAARLRCHGMECKEFAFGWRAPQGWIGAKIQWTKPINDGAVMFHLGQVVLERVWHNEPLRQVQVTALAPLPQSLQRDLFDTLQANKTTAAINQVMDAINARFGEFSLMPAPLLNRSQMHNVIAPAWKPHGHRRTV